MADHSRKEQELVPPADEGTTSQPQDDVLRCPSCGDDDVCPVHEDDGTLSKFQTCCVCGEVFELAALAPSEGHQTELSRASAPSDGQGDWISAPAVEKAPDIREHLDRVEMMASGDDKWDLSENDRAALRALLMAYDTAVNELDALQRR